MAVAQKARPIIRQRSGSAHSREVHPTAGIGPQYNAGCASRISCAWSRAALDLNQRPLTDARTICGGFPPCAPAVDELGPERERCGTASAWLVDRAAAFDQEMTVAVAGIRRRALFFVR